MKNLTAEQTEKLKDQHKTLNSKYNKLQKKFYIDGSDDYSIPSKMAEIQSKMVKIEDRLGW